MTNAKEHWQHLGLLDSGDLPYFVLPSNVESVLLSDIAYRTGFPEFKQKSQIFRLNFPTYWMCTVIAATR